MHRQEASFVAHTSAVAIAARAPDAAASVPMTARKIDQSVRPRAPSAVVLLNPSAEKNAAGIGERTVSEEARPQLHRERPDSSAPQPTVEKTNDQNVALSSPGVMLLNPTRDKQAAGGGERTVPQEARRPLHRERRGESARPATVARKNDQSVPSAKAVPRNTQWPREKIRAYRSTEFERPGPCNESASFQARTTRDLRGLRRTSRLYVAPLAYSLPVMPALTPSSGSATRSRSGGSFP